jgi:hypothetical protein
MDNALPPNRRQDPVLVGVVFGRIGFEKSIGFASLD